jgi:hypothetical protein
VKLLVIFSEVSVFFCDLLLFYFSFSFLSFICCITLLSCQLHLFCFCCTCCCEDMILLTHWSSLVTMMYPEDKKIHIYSLLCMREFNYMMYPEDKNSSNNVNDLCMRSFRFTHWSSLVTIFL